MARHIRNGGTGSRTGGGRSRAPSGKATRTTAFKGSPVESAPARKTGQGTGAALRKAGKVAAAIKPAKVRPARTAPPAARSQAMVIPAGVDQSTLQLVAAAIARANARGTRIVIEVEGGEDGRLSVIEPPREPAAPSERTERQAALDQARERGARRAAEIVLGEGMLTVDELAGRLGMAPEAVEARRDHGEFLGLEAPGHEVRYPEWQIVGGEPLAVLPDLRRLLGSGWAVYRFLCQRHPEFGDRTGREVAAEPDGARRIVEVCESRLREPLGA